MAEDWKPNSLDVLAGWFGLTTAKRIAAFVAVLAAVGAIWAGGAEFYNAVKTAAVDEAKAEAEKVAKSDAMARTFEQSMKTTFDSFVTSSMAASTSTQSALVRARLDAELASGSAATAESRAAEVQTRLKTLAERLPASAADLKTLLEKMTDAIAAAKKLQSSIPTGTIAAYGGLIDDAHLAPDGWLLCDGKPVPTDSTYDSLRAKLKEGAWPGGGSLLPDLRGMFLRGADGDAQSRLEFKDLGPRDPAGFVVGSVERDAFGTTDTPRRPPSSSEALVSIRAQSEGVKTVVVFGADKGDAPREADSKETRPKNAAVNWIIKY